MSDPFCQECDGKGYIIEQAYEDELDDENMNVNNPIPCMTCSDREISNQLDEVS